VMIQAKNSNMIYCRTNIWLVPLCGVINEPIRNGFGVWGLLMKKINVQKSFVCAPLKVQLYKSKAQSPTLSFKSHYFCVKI
jgi:hypothetical protein